MTRYKVRRTGERKIYIHNDLIGAASYAKENIGKKLQEGIRDHIAFDYMTCLMMLAFKFEAQINFLGFKLVGAAWKEKDPQHKKVARILKILKLHPNLDMKPYSSIQVLREFRNEIVHGKPVEIKIDQIDEMTRDEIGDAIDLTSPWVKFCNKDAVFTIYDDVDAIWRELLKASGMENYETLTRGSGGITLISVVDTSDTAKN